MSRRKKYKAPTPDPDDAPPKAKPAPERINSPFEALKGLKAAPKSAKARPPVKRRPEPKKKAPARQVERGADPLAEYDYADRAAFQQAFAGVRPLDGAAGPARGKRKGKGQSAPKKTRTQVSAARRDQAENDARARLDALVGGGQSFKIDHDGDGGVSGRRSDMPAAAAHKLWSRFSAPERRLDLHGVREEEASREVVRFVRDSHRKGARHLLIIHGKGHHSDGGVGVLRRSVVNALTRGGAAPVVFAFQSAPTKLGGNGALLVYLTS